MRSAGTKACECFRFLSYQFRTNHNQGVMNMKCPVCGAAELIHDTRDLPYTHKGESTVIAAVTGDFCPACAESILDATESDRVMREMRHF
ncbi:type II toxin-antitoxin system MqsA family antitoxin [Pseudomonas sp. CCI4.2]|uniref:type II toxin-antitoxin system MqsA family antitoxin n=2 Tax=Pseudomonas sp. CCI4.2 TaxID=3048620 RepID=UPI002B234EC1|nr:type II toxin-antitoxin system MqsA family antitoxin [Pseudomonas sp. CCI4.2]